MTIVRLVLIGLYLFLLAYLPGALLFRIPDPARHTRAALAAEERVFWSVLIGAACSSLIVLALAWYGGYTFRRLLGIDATLAIVLIAVFRQRLSFGGAARRPEWRAIYPLVLVVLGILLYFPTAEYIIGGRDPGGYINEGIQIAQRGRLVALDPVVAALPAAYRDLFFPSHHVSEYYGVRFMGFFVVDPDAGSVVGQFPHLYPAWIAIGYGVYGLTGALYALGAWAILGTVAVYMLGARLLGRDAAFVAAVMLAVSVVQVWFARFPNSEMMAQALVFGGLLAYARAHTDGDRFFAPVAGALLALTLFLRFDAVVALTGVALTMVIGLYDGKKPRAIFVATFGAIAMAAAWYLFTVMAQYMARPLGYVRNLRALHIAALSAGVVALVVLATISRSAKLRRALRLWIPVFFSVAFVALAAYAYFLRPSLAGRGLAFHDAASLRTFGWYLPPAGIAAAVIGYSLIARRRFWRDPAFFATFAVGAVFVFYKLQIVPEHFWLARRFVPLVMPACLLSVAAIAAEYSRLGTGGGEARPFNRRSLALLRVAIPVALMVVLAWWLVQRLQPIRKHIEYEGLIPRVETLAHRFADEDLLVVESRDAGSDVHVFATPLAYIYARNVLLLSSAAPDKVMFREFLLWARQHYRNVYFLGGGGTDLLSRSIGVTPEVSDRFQVPEYERSLDHYPTRVRFKEFEYGLYRFTAPAGAARWFVLDVGTLDDLHVVRFNAKERSNTGVTFRWTRGRSFVALVGMRATDRLLMLWMSGGPRPASAGIAQVRVALNGRPIGEVQVGSEFAPYSFSIPADLAAQAAATDEPARLTIESTTWNPLRALGVPDDRELGVMLDRVEVR